MPGYKFFLTSTFPYKDRIVDTQKKGNKKPVFDIFYPLIMFCRQIIFYKLFLLIFYQFIYCTL